MHKAYKRWGAEIFIILNECSDHEGGFFSDQPVSQPSDRKVMVQVVPKTISNHKKDKMVIMNSHHGFMKGK